MGKQVNIYSFDKAGETGTDTHHVIVEASGKHPIASDFNNCIDFGDVVQVMDDSGVAYSCGGFGDVALPLWDLLDAIVQDYTPSTDSTDVRRFFLDYANEAAAALRVLRDNWEPSKDTLEFEYVSSDFTSALSIHECIQTSPAIRPVKHYNCLRYFTVGGDPTVSADCTNVSVADAFEWLADWR